MLSFKDDRDGYYEFYDDADPKMYAHLTPTPQRPDDTYDWDGSAWVKNEARATLNEAMTALIELEAAKAKALNKLLELELDRQLGKLVADPDDATVVAEVKLYADKRAQVKSAEVVKAL